MSNRYSRANKHDEHVDQTPLGKIQQQYWTTKQQVIKKLGKKEDEFVILSDAELDAKLDLFETIEQSSVDLLRVIEMYQDQIINLSIEESEMSTFMKSQSTYDTKTKAGKMMAAVSKAQNFAAQHRNSLRLPLVRLYNEVETFRFRAVADTFITVRKMENARTEYRGALLWMKNVSAELDPDATRKLEKFRRVQAQVKKTKTKFDRLKVDVTQKVDMLSASRCNMFSHVLVTYQRTLILFWTKTAKTFSAVAEAFKGYDHYEFNIIKDLVEPSKQMARNLNNAQEKLDNDVKLDDQSVPKEKIDTLIDFDEKADTVSNLSEIDMSQHIANNSETMVNNNKSVDEVNELIDLMTINEASGLNEQLRELELLESEKKKRMATNGASKESSLKNRSEELSNKLSDFGAFVTSSSVSDQAAAANLVDLDMGLQQTALKEVLNNASDEFEREWQSAFISPSDSVSNSINVTKAAADPQSSDPMSFFSQLSKSREETDSNSTSSLNTGSALFGEGVLNPVSSLANASEISKSQPETNKKNLSAWYDLFAELDPIKNPDAIGQQEGVEEERNC